MHADGWCRYACQWGYIVFVALFMCVCAHARVCVCGWGPLAPLTGRSLAVRLESQSAEPWGFVGVVR